MNPYLHASLRLGPKAVERLLGQIPEGRFDEALKPDRFTIRQVIAHLADWEPFYLARIERILREPGCTVEVFDEGERAIEGRYERTAVWDELARWKEDRERTALLIESLTERDLQTVFRHPVSGEMRLEDVVNMLAGHDLYHVEQLTEYLEVRRANL